MATVIIVGAGQGGFQTAASLRQNGFDGDVVLVGEEPGLPYQRPPLSKEYLQGKVRADQLQLRPEAFYRDHRIEYLEGERVALIEPRARRATLASGRVLNYDHLVLATGGHNRTLPLPGADLKPVHHLRTLAETDALREDLDGAENIVVIGAGFIGLKFTAVALAKGAKLDVIEATERPMARVVSVETSRFFAEAHHKLGATVHLGVRPARIVGSNGRVAAVELTDGTRLPAELVLISIGLAPNAELATEAGLATGNGIVVDEQLVTSDPNISAIGDCALFPSVHAGGRARLESVQNAVDHGRCVADRLTGKPHPYTAVPWFWSDQGDLKLQIAGITTGYDRAVIRGSEEKGQFSVFCFAGQKLLGIESINRPADHMAGRRLLGAGRTLTPDQARDESFDLKAHATAR